LTLTVAPAGCGEIDARPVFLPSHEQLAGPAVGTRQDEAVFGFDRGAQGEV
jgi:hypothetical protein